MGLFHHHRYKTTSVKFTPPVSRGVTTKDPNAYYIVERAIWGFTHVVKECQDCGKLKTYTYIGEVDIEEDNDGEE